MGKHGNTGRLYLFIFLGSKITADGDCSCEIKRCLLLGRKAMTNLDSLLKRRDITLPTKGPSSQGYGFSSSHVWMWVQFSSVHFSCSAVSNSLQPHGLQHARLPCPLPTPGACSNSYPLSQWCHPTISSSVSSSHPNLITPVFKNNDLPLADGKRGSKRNLKHEKDSPLHCWLCRWKGLCDE